MKRIEKGRITAVKTLADNLALIEIDLPLTAGEALPGNFVSLLPPLESGKYLRRPFSIAGISGSCIELVIKGIGPVTKSLLSFEAGREISVLGPLGNRYSLDFTTIWMIGGGTGIASLLFLNSSRIAGKGKGAKRGDMVLWAGKTSSMIPSASLLAESRFRNIFHSNISLATDDGSSGEKGTASEVLQKWLLSGKYGRPEAIVACGPHGMMKAVREVADRENIPAWFSLEEFMACGAGACAGCAVPAAGGGYLKACEDGPVFAGKEVLL